MKKLLIVALMLISGSSFAGANNCDLPLQRLIMTYVAMEGCAYPEALRGEWNRRTFPPQEFLRMANCFSQIDETKLAALMTASLKTFDAEASKHGQRELCSELGLTIN